MRLSDARRRPGWRSVITVAAVALLIVLLGHHCGQQLYKPRVLHPSQLSLSSLGGAFVVNAEQVTLADRSLSTCHHVFATAPLPPVTTDLIALGFAAALVAITGLLGLSVRPAGRSPPRGLATVLTGQDLLTRFCLSRR